MSPVLQDGESREACRQQGFPLMVHGEGRVIVIKGAVRQALLPFQPQELRPTGPFLRLRSGE